MTILDTTAPSEDKRSRQFFIRIENFPSSAGHADVKAFFNGLTISPGGVIIRGSNVFVSFEQWRDMTAAMQKDGHSIYNHKLLLSIVELKEVQQVCERSCQRHLQFESDNKVSKQVETSKEGSPEGLRKIRPTAVQGGDQISLRDVLTFSPKEVENETCAYEQVMDCTTCRRLSTTGAMRRRKIKPTPVRCIADCTSAFMQTMMKSAILSSD